MFDEIVWRDGVGPVCRVNLPVPGEQTERQSVTDSGCKRPVRLEALRDIIRENVSELKTTVAKFECLQVEWVGSYWRSH